MNNILIANVTDTEINVLLNKTKYQLFDKIKNNHLEFVVNEIFDLGYNQYMRNLIKSDIQLDTQIPIQTFTQINQNTTNAITESKYSTLKGSLGENIVIDILIDKFPNCLVENTSKIPHSGDIQLTLPSKHKLIVEVKNYNKTIDQEQIDKLKFDMGFNNIKGALFVSLNSGIVGRKKFELEFFKINANNCFIIYLPYSMHKSIPEKKNIISHNSIDDSIINLSIKLEFGICVIQNIILNLYSINSIMNSSKFINPTDLDYLVSQFDSLFNEFKNIKNSIRKLDESIKKSLDSHKLVINDYENLILNKISNLIGNKLGGRNWSDENNKFQLEKNNNEFWNILIDGNVYGMIVCVYGCWDILIDYQKNLINKQFGNFIECANYLNQLFQT